MEFGYFTLSDNHYESNTPVSANQFVAEITAGGALCRGTRHALGLDR